jgi:hypothetical protein
MVWPDGRTIEANRETRIPMLSSLVHAGLVWREEYMINKEIKHLEQSSSEAPTLVNASPRIDAQVVETSENTERTPLIANRVIGYSGTSRKPSRYGRVYSERGSNPV